MNNISLNALFETDTTDDLAKEITQEAEKIKKATVQDGWTKEESQRPLNPENWNVNGWAAEESKQQRNIGATDKEYAENQQSGWNTTVNATDNDGGGGEDPWGSGAEPKSNDAWGDTTHAPETTSNPWEKADPK